MKITTNDYDGLYAVPDHPVTPLNPFVPWKIEEMRILQQEGRPVVYIRGENTMWFRASHCFCNIFEECQDYMNMKGIK
jgi:hypothetical protein